MFYFRIEQRPKDLLQRWIHTLQLREEFDALLIKDQEADRGGASSEADPNGCSEKKGEGDGVTEKKAGSCKKKGKKTNTGRPAPKRTPLGENDTDAAA